MGRDDLPGGERIPVAAGADDPLAWTDRDGHAIQPPRSHA
jgi:hypothetical protein